MSPVGPFSLDRRDGKKGYDLTVCDCRKIVGATKKVFQRHEGKDFL